MINGDIFTCPIDYALNHTMKEIEGDVNHQLIYDALKRSRALWENIKINGLEINGLTYEQFCEQMRVKRNIIFLTDKEKETYIKAIKQLKKK